MHNYSAIRRILLITMALNWLATAVKLYAAFRTGTLSLAADGFDSFFDGLSNIVGVAAVWMAAQPPDRDHPYGHRKFETIAALGIVLLLGITVWELAQGAIGRFGNPVLPEVGLLSFGAIVFGIAVQGSAATYEFWQGRRLRSEILLADARHSAASILVSLAVLVGLPFLQMGYAWVDPALTLVVAAVIARIGYDILRESAPVLLDQAAVDPEEIARVLDQVEGVTSYHRIRSRGAADESAVDLHLRVEPDLSVARANAIADEVRDRLLNVDGINDVTIHLEAQRHDQDSAAELHAAIQTAAAGRPVTIHEVSLYRDNDGEARAEIHIGVPPQFTVAQAHALVCEIEEEIRAAAPWVCTLHTHIEPAIHELVPGTLLPSSETDAISQTVHEAIATVPELRQPSDLLVRRTPEGLFLSLNVAAEPGLSVSASHALAHVVSERVRKRLPHVLEVAVHVEPDERRMTNDERS